ncbi:MAG: LuxR C-terminal-related transcriptional regulator [Candidatus Thermoplasmatota archaeon]|nr:LuxR C-terminal-related transcriptional regulator [Candidatus Thermoplasmatota archaeon]
MGFITGRERQILRLLKGGRKVMEIADELGVKMSSISRSISNVRHKCMEIEDDVDFLQEVGFLDIVDGDIEFISRDPKDLRPRP